MNAFRNDGVYLKMYDAFNDGYYTMENSKMKKHKYGLLNKLYDIYTYGKTMNISYGYVYFYKSRNKNVTQLYMGSIKGELSEILAKWQSSPHFGSTNDPHWQDFIFTSDDMANYYDQKERKCYLTIFREGSLLIRDYFDFNSGEIKSNEYQFYPLPR